MADPAAFEDLAALCLARMEEEGEAALEAVCAAHPEQAPALRQVIGRLSRVGLTQSSPPRDDPKQLGEYRILRRLGSGGMGVVYLAEQPRLGRKVALKVLRPGALLQPRTRERFRREVEALSRLDHPNLGTVYDAGEIDGTPYLSMRAVEGSSLAELLDRARQERADQREKTPGSRATTTVTGSLHALLIVLEKVARALHAAHEAGVVHRDVKPGNVLIDRDGEPIVVDFGLVRAEVDAETLTQTGDQLGTPSHMAPEQIEPSIGSIDRRTDVYALGVLAYECLTLRLPYEASTREALYRRILHGDAPEPRVLERRIAPELSLVVRRAMDRDPARRFATAAAFADELERVRAHRPIESRRQAVHRRVLQWCRRNRVASVFVGALGVGLAVSLVLLVALGRALTRADAALEVNAIHQLATRSPEQAFLAARDLLHRQPSPKHASLVQELMGELYAEAVVSVGGLLGGSLRLSPDGRLFAVLDRERRVAVGRFDGTPPKAVGPWKSMGGLSFDESGKELAVGTAGGEVHVVRLDDGTTRALPLETPLPSAGPGFVSLSWRAGRLLGVNGREGWHVWDSAGTRLRSARLDGFTPAIGALSGDGHHAVLGEMVPPGARSRLVIHDLETDSTRVIDGLTGQSLSIVATSDRCAAATTGGQFLVAGLDGRVVKLTAELDRECTSIAFDATGTRLVGTDSAGGIRLLDADGGSLAFYEVPGSVQSAVFSADGSRIAAACWGDQTVRVFDLAGNRLLEAAVLRGHSNGVSRVAFDASDRDRVVSTGWDGTVRSWRVRPSAVRTGSVRHASLSRVLCGPDGRILATAGSGDVRVWNAQLEPLAAFDVRSDLQTGWLTQPLLSADGAEVGIGTSFGPCLAWRWREEPRPSALPAQNQGLPCPVVPLGNGRFATIVGENRGQQYVTMLATARCGDSRWQRWRDFPAVHFAQVTSMTFARELDRLVTFDGEMTARVWLLDDAQLRLLTTLPRTDGFAGLFTKDGQMLFIGGEDGITRLWDLRSGAPRLTLEFRGHDGHVRALALPSDDRRLLTASSDKTLRLWGVASGSELLVLRGHKRNVTGCCFTADGTRALSASVDGTVREWWLTVEDIAQAAQAIAVPQK